MLCFVLFLITGCNALQWLPDVRNGSTIRACAGSDVMIPWNYALDQFEEAVDVEWYFAPHYSNTSNCTSRWSDWINRDHPTSDNDDVERMTSREMTQFCPDGHVTDVQCQSIQGFPVHDGEETLQCSVKHGFVCRDALISPVSCNDYQIRYFCRCSGDQEFQLATYRSGVFLQNSHTSQNVTHRNDTTDAGLTLHDVTVMDSGVYSTMVTFKEFEVYRSAYQYVTVVIDPSEHCSSAPADVTTSGHNDVMTTERNHLTTLVVPVG